MRKSLVFLLAAAMLLSLTACRVPLPNLVQPETALAPGSVHSGYDGISIRITGVSRQEDNLVLDVDWINETAYEAIFGESYTIERKEGDEWVSCQIPEELVFHLVAYVLSPGQIREERYTLTNLFDISRPGTYRFRSDVSVNTGAADYEDFDVWEEFTLTESTAAGEDTLPEPIDYGVQYIRTDGYQEGAQFPQVAIIRSYEELEHYYQTNKDTFFLERREQVCGAPTPGFLDACDKYGPEYFETGYLVFVILEEGSGSIRHKVTGSTVSSQGELGIWIETLVPEVGTDDMAQWHILLELNNTVTIKDETAVRVYLDGAPAFAEGMPIENTMAPATEIFQEPPGATLLHGIGTVPLRVAGHHWNYPQEDGTWVSVIADAQHPLYCQNLLEPIYAAGEFVKLVFEDEPDSIKIRCWPDTAWNSSTAVSLEVNCYGSAFDLMEGGFIYEISAIWEKSETEHHGAASYYAYILQGEEHIHHKAIQPQTVENPITGYCGNTQTTVHLNGADFTFMGGDSVALTDILVNLDYDPNKLCRCLPEFTVDTEFGAGYGIHLTAGYARCEKGQAALTVQQVQQIREILQRLQGK